jgi:dCTP deaminase
MLCDRTIRKLLANTHIGIDPMPVDACFQPASVDLSLGTSFVAFWPTRMLFTAPVGEVVELGPGQSMLATTAEALKIPRDVVARVEGKSTWGRRFLMVHSTAGFVDPGFEGQITLELHNLGRTTLALVVGAPIAQVSFDWLDGPAERPYGADGLNSHYQRQLGATEAAPGDLVAEEDGPADDSDRDDTTGEEAA